MEVDVGGGGQEVANEPSQKKARTETIPSTNTEVTPLGSPTTNDYKTLSSIQKRRAEILGHCDDSKISIDKADLSVQEEYFDLVKKESGLKKTTAQFIEALKGHGNFAEKDVKVWCDSVFSNDMNPNLQESICTFAGASRSYASANDAEFERTKKRVLELEGQLNAQKKAVSPPQSQITKKPVAPLSNNNNNNNQSGQKTKAVDPFYSNFAPQKTYGKKPEVNLGEDFWSDFGKCIDKYSK
jgi:hypothetical protein